MNLSRLDDRLMGIAAISKSFRGYFPAENTERNFHDAGTSVGHFDSEFMEDGH
jgi:hypothetical protein